MSSSLSLSLCSLWSPTGGLQSISDSKIPTLKKLTHLPVIVDPSHGTGKTELVIPMAKAAIAAGADGLMIEMHPNPIEAFSDGPQSLTPDEFKTLMTEIKPFIKIAGKTLC